MLKLYELSDHIAQVEEMLENGAEGLEDTLEALEGSFQSKVESIVKLIHSKHAQAQMINDEVTRLSGRQAKLKKDADWLLNYVDREMQKANMTEVKSPLFSIKLGLNPPRVEVLDEFMIPEKYMRTLPATTAPDKNAIKEALQRGEGVPGCEIRQDLKLKIK